eukprot:4604732-Prorocentrum_lima.AAC.1
MVLGLTIPSFSKTSGGELRTTLVSSMGFINGCVQKGRTDVCSCDGFYPAIGKTQDHPEQPYVGVLSQSGFTTSFS